MSGGSAIFERDPTVGVRPWYQRTLAAAAFCGLLGACSTGNVPSEPIVAPSVPLVSMTVIPKGPPRASEERIAMANFAASRVRTSSAGAAIAAAAARGQLLEPDPSGYDQIGMASWYGGRFHGRPTATGEIFNRTQLTAAHPSLPLPSYVRVTNLENDRSIVLRVNDRGPYAHGRMLDVSEQAAELLAFRHRGSTKVRVQYISPSPLNGEDDTAMLLATFRGPILPISDALAFARPEESILGTEAVLAINRIAEAAEADERIVMAFDVARQADQ